MTQTNEIGDLINAIGNVQISKYAQANPFSYHHLFIDGESDCLKAIKIAQLSLKHRQNKAQR